jgi:magnesium and cobalt transporter
MLNMTANEQDSPHRPAADIHLTESYASVKNGNDHADAPIHDFNDEDEGLFGRLRRLFTGNKAQKSGESALKAANNDGPGGGVALHERMLFSNIINLRDLTVVDVMIPRADIVALDIASSQQDLLSLLAQKQFSRFPVYRNTLDDVLGTIHIKDILSCLAQRKPVVIEELVREVPIVSPALPILDLILLMKQMRKHMALVVDEYGGIDGLVTIGDVIEVLIGEVEDEYDSVDEPEIKVNEDGSLIADGRYDMDAFEEQFGPVLTDDEREDIDTLGGLVFAIAGRIPGRGEVLSHPATGIIFEIIDADPRRVNKLLIRNLPDKGAADDSK